MRAHAAIACLLISFTAASTASPKLIYRVDEATAEIVGHHLMIVAKGAVRTGGWERPRLTLRDSPGLEVHEVTADFMATPPRNEAVVAQSVLPVTVRLRARLPRYAVTQVKVVSETNSVTAQIIVRQPAQKTAFKGK
ncbi:MAG: hypothetical protein KGJ78_15500 [Alphaproteobacteria bacterium]|nr:hypothetical protein [Alphaproteobacteria bacterium]